MEFDKNLHELDEPITEPEDLVQYKADLDNIVSILNSMGDPLATDIQTEADRLQVILSIVCYKLCFKKKNYFFLSIRLWEICIKYLLQLNFLLSVAQCERARDIRNPLHLKLGRKLLQWLRGSQDETEMQINAAKWTSEICIQMLLSWALYHVSDSQNTIVSYSASYILSSQH